MFSFVKNVEIHENKYFHLDSLFIGWPLNDL